jgi:branched-subunit amino acid aminotransferase/4-amino-4-deoxychorismate lyase
LAQDQGQDVQFDRITLNALSEADEVFLVGTTIEVIPVVNVDGQTIQPVKSKCHFNDFMAFDQSLGTENEEN